MTKMRAWQGTVDEVPVIAVDDGNNHAICVTSDKHWTVQRDWSEVENQEELYSRAEIMEELLNSPNEEMIELDESRVYANIERNRAVRESERLRKILKTQQGRVALVEEEVRELKDPMHPVHQQARAWMRVSGHEFFRSLSEDLPVTDAIMQRLDQVSSELSETRNWAEMEKRRNETLRSENKELKRRATGQVVLSGESYSRLVGLAEEAEEAKKAYCDLYDEVHLSGSPFSAVSRADIERVVSRWWERRDGQQELEDDLWELHEHVAQAALVVLETAVEAVEVEHTHGGNWSANGTGIPRSWSSERVREMRDECAEEWVELEAIARAIDIENTPEPKVPEAQAERLNLVIGRW